MVCQCHRFGMVKSHAIVQRRKGKIYPVGFRCELTKARGQTLPDLNQVPFSCRNKREQIPWRKGFRLSLVLLWRFSSTLHPFENLWGPELSSTLGQQSLH